MDDLLKFDEQHPSYKRTIAAIFYGVCSVCMAFINKVLLTTYDFDYPVFIMGLQMLFTISLLELLSWLRLIDLPAYSLERGKAFLIPSLLYGITSVLSLSALSGMNLAMYGILKRCVPLVTLILSIVVLKKGYPSKRTVLSVVLLTVGCVIAGFGDVKFNLIAYGCGTLSILVHALYLLLVQRFSQQREVSTVETLQLNSINTLPFFVVAALVNGEIQHVRNYSDYKNLGFIFFFLLTISFGCVLNYAIFLCTSLTSAVTTSVVGGLKALCQTLIGLVTFGGVSHNAPTFIGIALNLSGGILYIYAKYTEGKAKTVTAQVRHVMSFSTGESLRDLKSGMSNGNLQTLEEVTEDDLTSGDEVNMSEEKDASVVISIGNVDVSSSEGTRERRHSEESA